MFDPERPEQKAFLEKARHISKAFTKFGHRGTTMGEVAIADGLNRIAEALEKLSEKPKPVDKEAEPVLDRPIQDRVASCPQVLVIQGTTSLVRCEVLGRHHYNEDNMEVHIASYRDTGCTAQFTWSLLTPVSPRNQGSDRYPM